MFILGAYTRINPQALFGNKKTIQFEKKDKIIKQ